MRKIEDVLRSIKEINLNTTQIDKCLAIVSSEVNHVKEIAKQNSQAYKEHLDKDAEWHASIDKKIGQVGLVCPLSKDIQKLVDANIELRAYDISQNGKIDIIKNVVMEAKGSLSTWKYILAGISSIATILSILLIYLNRDVKENQIRHVDVKHMIEQEVISRLEKFIDSKE